MSVSPQDVQAKLDQSVKYLEKTTSSYTQMVKKYGDVWQKWPTGSYWYMALSEIAAARAEVGKLPINSLSAKFSYKEF